MRPLRDSGRASEPYRRHLREAAAGAPVGRVAAPVARIARAASPSRRVETSPSRCITACLSACVLLLGCGARTSPLPVAAAPGDAGLVVDAGPGDGGGRADAAPPDAGAPRACSADRDCAGGTVCRADLGEGPVDLAPVPLACATRTAGAAADDAACDGVDGTGCARGLCVVAGTCVAPCIDDADCAAEARCAEVYARTGPAALQPLRACVPLLAAPPDVRVRVDRAVAEVRGGDVPVDVALPHEAPVTLAVFSSPRSLALLAPALRGPDGATVFDLDALAPGAPPPRSPINPFGAPLTVLLPAADDAAPGTYTLALAAGSRTAIDRVLLARDLRGRTLDLDLYLVAGRFAGRGDGGLVPALAEALEVFRATYAEAGIAVGEVRTHTLVGGLARRFGVIEGDGSGDLPELGPLFALTAGARGPSVSWFFVRDVEGALGVSGGVPGAQCLPGTAASGLVVSGDLLGGDVALESVLVHETGHFLGLFHTSERDGTVLDPFEDTPACGPSRDVDGDGALVYAECLGAGAENAMFWGARNERRFSEAQRALLGRALVLR